MKKARRGFLRKAKDSPMGLGRNSHGWSWADTTLWTSNPPSSRAATHVAPSRFCCVPSNSTERAARHRLSDASVRSCLLIIIMRNVGSGTMVGDTTTSIPERRGRLRRHRDVAAVRVPEHLHGGGLSTTTTFWAPCPSSSTPSTWSLSSNTSSSSSAPMTAATVINIHPMTPSDYRSIPVHFRAFPSYYSFTANRYETVPLPSATTSKQSSKRQCNFLV